jgi:cyclophilin family peptidyl-prolyl cis-trans isomerase/HEAT repeat protein
MADARRLDDAVIDDALGASNSSLRAAGAIAIGQLRATTYLPRLTSLLTGSDTAVAAAAAYALGLLRDSAAIAPLTRAVDGPPSVAAEAAWALGELGAPARQVIDSLLMQGDLVPGVTGPLLLSAAKMRPLPLDAILRHVDSPDTAVAWRAAYALSRTRTPGGVRALTAKALAADPMMRQQVARAIARPAAGDSLGPAARAALDLLAVARESHVRINAVRSLATYGEPARAAVVAATRDRDANVRIAAAQSLIQVMDRDLRRWAWLWESDTALTYRKAILAAAIRIGVDLPSMREWRGSADWRHRAAVATAATGALTAQRAAQLALPLTRDPDGRVRAAAFDALAGRLDSLPIMRDSFRVALLDRDVMVRATAVQALARNASAADAPAVLATYRRAIADTLDDARVAAIAFLRMAWQRDSASFSDSLRFAIAELEPPFEQRVLAAARGIPLFAAWGAAPAPARPPEWYEDVVRRLVVPALAGRLPLAHIVTARGTIEVELFAGDAPLTVDNFIALARRGFYRNTAFHRVVPNFVAQDGDPRGDGSGGPGYAIRDEINRHRYGRGVLGMALSGPDTGGSQYFLTHSPQPHLDGGYTVFGRVTRGFDALDAIVEGDRLIEIRIP